VSGEATIRAYGPSDFEALVRLIGDAFGGESPDSVRFVVSAANTATFVAELDGAVVGVSMAISFGQTAWIGNVVVSADCRRRGLGMSLTEAACRAAGDHAETVLLLALGDARRLYERLGFVADGLYGTWTATASTPAIVQAAKDVADVRRAAAAARPDTVQQCLALDRRATGEDRRAYLEYFIPAMTAAWRGDGEDDAGQVTGYAARLSWGTGAVVADDVEVARGLLCDLLRQIPTVRVEFPDANDAGVRLATDLGLERVKENLRMRLGPPVAGYRPQAVYKALTPAVG